MLAGNDSYVTIFVSNARLVDSLTKGPYFFSEPQPKAHARSN
jgi:hypothetical protein